MSWRRWKVGLLVAVITGVGQALVAWTVDCTVKQIVSLTAVNVGANLVLFLKQHPVESITSDSNPAAFLKHAP